MNKNASGMKEPESRKIKENAINWQMKDLMYDKNIFDDLVCSDTLSRRLIEGLQNLLS